MDAFFESSHFLQLQPLVHALPVLTALLPFYEFHVVTSRQHKIESITREWIDTHYPHIFTEIHFGNHYSSGGVSRSKPEMCEAIGAWLLIDDSLIYTSQCAKAGIQTILFGDYAWNTLKGNSADRTYDGVTIVPYTPENSLLKGNDGSTIVYRAKDWDSVRDIIEALALSRGIS